MPHSIDISPVPSSSARHPGSSRRLSEKEPHAQALSGREINERRAAVEDPEALRRARAL
jgi:hypothetical protein